MSSAPDVKEVRFGPFVVTKQVFCVTPLSFALVNLKPIVPGHVLTADLFTTVQLMQRVLARVYFTDPDAGGGDKGKPAKPAEPSAGSFTVAVQDGPDSGQTVPHVHVHVIPRTRGDLGDAMDEIYVRMAGEEGNVGGALWDVATATAKRPVPDA
ncbi:hypothetical protein ACCO45_011134 [Purpureocillium lilacinum]|uniref:Uncharacterized protein n=1 Tax=Purpureocillium lilacinum TaxID=33203 RepID=A0ACC4DJE5_PURLI